MDQVTNRIRIRVCDDTPSLDGADRKSLASLFAYPFGIAVLCLMLNAGIAPLPLFVLSGVVLGGLIAFIFSSSRIFKWCVSILGGAVFAVGACLGDGRTTAPVELGLWIKGVLVCVLYGAIATAFAESAAWVFRQIRLNQSRRISRARYEPCNAKGDKNVEAVGDVMRRCLEGRREDVFD